MNDPTPLTTVLESFVLSLGKLLGVQVLWKDSEDRFDAALNPEACRHTCTFCLGVKTDSLRLARCMVEDGRFEIAKLVTSQSLDPGTTGGFLRPCHAGVIDFVYPVSTPVRYLGAFFVGPWRSADLASTYPELVATYGSLPVLPPDLKPQLDSLLEPPARLVEQSRIGGVGLTEPDRSSLRISRAIEFMTSYSHQPLRAFQVARVCNLSTSRFLHLFTQETGLSFSSFLRDLRLKRAKELLMNSKMSIEEVAAQSGFPTRTYFSRVFREMSGLTPGMYRRLLG